MSVSIRPLSDVSEPTLRHLAAVTLSTEEMYEILLEPLDLDVRPSVVLERLVDRARGEEDVADRLSMAIDRDLCQSCPEVKAIWCLSMFLSQAVNVGNVHGVAAAVWRAARRNGLAWRSFEKRADAALELLALQQVSRPPLQRLP
jgi:hypothetical protein